MKICFDLKKVGFQVNCTLNWQVTDKAVPLSLLFYLSLPSLPISLILTLSHYLSLSLLFYFILSLYLSLFSPLLHDLSLSPPLQTSPQPTLRTNQGYKKIRILIGNPVSSLRCNEISENITFSSKHQN